MSMIILPTGLMAPKKEPSAMTVADDEKVHAALTRAAQQLDSAIKEQEVAVIRILGLCEVLHDKMNDGGSALQIEAIMEACSFQDLTGQRIRKVERLIRYLRDGDLVSPGDLPHEAAGEHQGLSQEQIDRLLAGGNPLSRRE